MTDLADTAARPVALVVMGVAGSGKSTTAGLLAGRLGWPLAEADDFHPEANVAKMSAGIALTDQDRGPWLAALRTWIDEQDGNVILTCSALRRRYRDELRLAVARVRFLHLDGDAQLLAARMTARLDHFMPPSLLASQLATLEPLDPDEDGLVVQISAAPGEIADSAYAWLTA